MMIHPLLRCAFVASIVLPVGGCSFLAGAAQEGEDAPTARISFSGNLDARDPIFPEPFDPTDPSGTARISATVEVHDENRMERALSFYFRKNAVSLFDYHVLVDASALHSESTAVGWVEVGHGRLAFDGTGALQDVLLASSLSIRFAQTDAPQQIELDFGSKTSAGGEGKDGFTQYALATSINYQSGSHED